MREGGLSASGWVQVTQGLVARELVESFGLAERQAARLLSVVPSAVSQYLSGKRLGNLLDRYYQDHDARQVAREAAQRLARTGEGGPDPRFILETAMQLAQRFGDSPVPARSPHRVRDRANDRSRAVSIRRRIAGEQDAVAECMRLAQKSRDELTRALFRQIASDSLRHAEIVASLATYLDRGVSRTVASGITRADVERLIAREQAAEEGAEPGWARELGGVMEILWESMESDEHKHARLLEGLLKTELPSPPVRASRRSPPRPAASPERPS
ncbi:MAG: hypothetical protein WCA77_00445 [Thermoplasmata archaeon]